MSPYEAARSEVRDLVGDEGFMMAYVDTPLDVCEARDVKGYYAKARRGELKGFTGVDDPYEVPVDPELALATADCPAEDNANKIIAHLVHTGFLRDAGSVC